ncbi:hypothetical protein [Crocosphaera sp. Alani8]
MYTYFLDLIDVRWLMVFSPIATAFIWGMIIYQESDLEDDWWF